MTKTPPVTGSANAILDAAFSRSNGDALAALVVAAYSSAMALAKVEQRGEPLRLCAKQLEILL